MIRQYVCLLQSIVAGQDVGFLTSTISGSRSQYMKKIAKRRITVTSSLYKLSTDQLRNRVGVRGSLPRPPLALFTASFHGQIVEDVVNGLPSTSDICFMSLSIPFTTKYN